MQSQYGRNIKYVIFSKLFNGDKEESPALTKEQKQIEKKLKD